MIALCVDDEYLLLKALKRVVEQSPDITEAVAFDDELDALAWARGHAFDVAFLDIQLHDMSGLELAQELRKINPAAAVVFCTGYRDYAVEALGLHMDSGYLVKPIEQEAVQRELDHIRASRPEKARLLTVRCYGGFEVYDKDGGPLHFRRSRARELLALLIHRRGMGMTAKEICALIFEDDGEQDQKNMNHFYKAYYELNRALRDVGAEEVLQKNGASYYVDLSLLRVDNTGEGSLPYLEDYSWAEYE